MGDEIRKIVKGKVKYKGDIEKIRRTINKGKLIKDDQSKFWFSMSLFLLVIDILKDRLK